MDKSGLPTLFSDSAGSHHMHHEKQKTGSLSFERGKYYPPDWQSRDHEALVYMLREAGKPRTSTRSWNAFTIVRCKRFTGGRLHGLKRGCRHPRWVYTVVGSTLTACQRAVTWHISGSWHRGAEKIRVSSDLLHYRTGIVVSAHCAETLICAMRFGGT